MNDSTTRRTDNIRVKLAPEMTERLERMAAAYGMPVATLCAFAIAEWVAGKEQNFANARMAVMDISRKLGGQMGDMLSQLADSPDLEAVVAQSAKSIASSNLPADGGS